MKQPELTYRSAAIADFDQCLAIDHSYETQRIWQMTINQKPEAIGVRFQPLRLPQTTTIAYPYDREELPKRWWEAHWFLVGEQQSKIEAYATSVLEALRPVAWVQDLAVAPALRRRGYGSELLSAAAQWAKQEEARFLMVAVPMKNDPAMIFLRKNGFTFCGYNEAQYKQRDIDLYFSMKL
ncbi:MAG: GNAT family N-acetyltransferase [Anaerolineales bacterium]|nr:GNAT family N-acetyltransferase [Anaerolineales bacterium]